MSLKLYEITPSLTPFTVDLVLSTVELAACSAEPIKLIPKICPNSRLEYMAILLVAWLVVHFACSCNLSA
jgi:hypothetical protein